MSYWRNSGNWNINVTINLTDATQVYDNSSFFYNVLTAHTMGILNINFSGIPGKTFNASNAYPLTIQNTGNKIINLSIKGTDFVGVTDSSVNISIENATYNSTELGVYKIINYSYVQIPELDNLNPRFIGNVYFRGTIPIGTKAQNYQNLISIQSS